MAKYLQGGGIFAHLCRRTIKLFVMKTKTLLMFGVGCMAAMCLTSRYSTRLTYGNVKPKEPMVQVNKVWNHHLIGGLVPVGNNKLSTEEYVNGAPNYMVKTNRSFLNGFISWVTGGIYTPSQTKFYVPLSDVQKVDGKIKTDE